MSIDINLLPWRNRMRERRRRRWRLALSVAVGIGLAAGMGAFGVHQDRLEAQRQRNAYIEAQLARLERDIQAADGPVAVHERMRDRAESLARLQASRSLTVEVFAHLAESLGEGVYYTHLSRQGDTLRLIGVAEDGRRLSAQLRSLEIRSLEANSLEANALAESGALGPPLLSDVDALDDDAGWRFTIITAPSMPAFVTTEDGEASGYREEGPP